MRTRAWISSMQCRHLSTKGVLLWEACSSHARRFYTSVVHTVRQAPKEAFTNILPADGVRPGSTSLQHLHTPPSLQVLRKAHDLLLGAVASEREHQQGANSDGDADAALPRGQNGRDELSSSSYRALKLSGVLGILGLIPYSTASLP